MKSDEFSGKMLDDHIEVFCYCNFDYYRNLFWCFCISIYEKEKGSCSGQYCLYWNYVCAVSDTAADWQFSAYMLGVVAAFLVMYVQDRRNIYQKIFLAVTFFLSVGLRLQWQAEWMILSQKLCFWEYDCRKTMATICNLCWNENSGYCALYRFPCSCNRSDQ